MSLRTRVSELVRACFTGIWIESHEHEDALMELTSLCRDESWRLARWNVEEGLQVGSDSVQQETAGDPLAAVRSLSSLGEQGQPTILVLTNFHRFLQSAEIVQAITKQVSAGKQNRTFVVILAPVVQLPAELEKQFLVIEHELPGREQLAEIARSIATEEEELPVGSELERVLDAAVGLTRYEAEGAFSLSLVRHGKLRADVLWEQKSQMLTKSGLLSLHRGHETFADLGGLEALKVFCLRALRKQPATANSVVRPRGVLLLSPPGCGKSAFAKSLGNETGRPTLTLDMGSLLGSLVGESERNMRQALKIIDAMAPCILFADELEKGLAGVSSQGDSGVSARLFGHLLTWLNDHTSDVFFVGTCNDISRLPPEFARAERFDAVTFIDLPTAEQRDRIWQLYVAKFGLDPAQKRPADDQWTGAEIRSCCRLAALLDLPLTAAAQNVVPIAQTASESIQRLRTWASGRCLSADSPGIYDAKAPAGGKRRQVQRDVSQN